MNPAYHLFDSAHALHLEIKCHAADHPELAESENLAELLAMSLGRCCNSPRTTRAKRRS